MPLLASAHEGHDPHGAGALPAAAAANGAIVAALSGCPGGGHENCCCHEGWCTTAPVSAAVMDAGWRELERVVPALIAAAHGDAPALPSAALLRFPPRGPPLLS